MILLSSGITGGICFTLWICLSIMRGTAEVFVTQIRNLCFGWSKSSRKFQFRIFLAISTASRAMRHPDNTVNILGPDAPLQTSPGMISGIGVSEISQKIKSHVLTTISLQDAQILLCQVELLVLGVSCLPTQWLAGVAAQPVGKTVCENFGRTRVCEADWKVRWGGLKVTNLRLIFWGSKASSEAHFAGMCEVFDFV